MLQDTFLNPKLTHHDQPRWRLQANAAVIGALTGAALAGLRGALAGALVGLALASFHRHRKTAKQKA